MLSATLREIDSAVRWERALQFWKRYKPLISGGVALLCLGLGVFAYSHNQTTVSLEKTSAQYAQALELLRHEKVIEAESLLRSLSVSGAEPYNTLAQFRLAGTLITRDSAAAAELFNTLAANPKIDSSLRDAARIRSVFLGFDTFTDLKAFENAYADLLHPQHFWHASIQELAGLLAWRTGHLDAAKTYFETIRSDLQAPVSLQERAGEFLELIAYDAHKKTFELSSSSPKKAP
jgi:hypothetical protein